MSFKGIFLGLGLVVLATTSAPEANAQLFKGWSLFSSPQQSRPIRLKPLRPLSPSRFNRFQSPRGRGSDEAAASWSGNYRTLCVRLCDGYYFPISYRASRNRMYHDAKVCEASCDCATKLYYLPSSSSDIKSAVDLSGQTYARLDKAFSYRREFDASCTCRPAPWSAEEAMRHDGYAIAAAERHWDVQSRKGEALMALIEREDEKERFIEEQRIAKLEREREEAERKAAARQARLAEAASRMMTKLMAEMKPEVTPLAASPVTGSGEAISHPDDMVVAMLEPTSQAKSPNVAAIDPPPVPASTSVEHIASTGHGSSMQETGETAERIPAPQPAVAPVAPSIPVSAPSLAESAQLPVVEATPVKVPARSGAALSLREFQHGLPADAILQAYLPPPPRDADPRADDDGDTRGLANPDAATLDSALGEPQSSFAPAARSSATPPRVPKAQPNLVQRTQKRRAAEPKTVGQPKNRGFWQL